MTTTAPAFYAPDLTPQQVSDVIDWIIALNSGEYLQIKETLKGEIWETIEHEDGYEEETCRGAGFCCLGVRVVTLDQKVLPSLGVSSRIDDNNIALWIDDRWEDSVDIPDVLTEYLGLNFPVPAERHHDELDRSGYPIDKYTRTLKETLIRYNDHGKTFAEIAEFLDRFLLRKQNFHDIKLLPTEDN